MKKYISLFLAFILIFSLPASIGFALDISVSFDKINADGIVDADDLSDFTVLVSSSDAQSVELFVNGVSQGVDYDYPYSFVVSTDYTGTHTALAKVLLGSGAYIEAEKDFTICEYTSGTICSQDYSGFVQGKKVWKPSMPGGTEWSFAGGEKEISWYQLGTEESGHSKAGNGSCIRFVPTRVDTSVLNIDPSYYYYYHYARFARPAADIGKSTHWRFETDFYMSSDAGKTGEFEFLIDTGSDKVLATAKSGNLVINGNNYAMSSNEWHNIILDFDTSKRKITAYLDDNKIVDKEHITASVTADFNYFKLRPKKINYEYRLDNTKLYCIIESPYCLGVNSGGELVEYADRMKQDVVLSFKPGIKNLDTSKLILRNEIGEVELSNVIYSANDATLTLTLKNGFEASNSYYLTIPVSTEFNKLGAISKPLLIKFKTSASPLDVFSGKIRTAGQKIFFETELVNTSGESKNLVAYISVYKNGVFEKLIKTENITLSSNGEKLKVSTPELTAEQGMLLKAFVIDNTGKPISNKFYTLYVE